MSKFVISKAMGNIPDDMLLEATEIKKKKSVGWVIFRAAACLAVVIGLLLAPLSGGGEGDFVTMPGVVKAYAYEVKDEENVDFSKLEEFAFVENQMKPGQNMWNPLTNYELAITPVVSEDDLQDYRITFEVSTEYGLLVGNYHNREKYKSYADAEMGKRANIENGETLYWEGHELNPDGESRYKGIEPGENTIYVELIIKADKHIIGYAIFEIVPVDGWGENAYTAVLVHSVYYPIVDGQFQTISEEFVRQEIENYKVN